MWFRGLIAAACVVVIAAGGLWIYQQIGLGNELTRDACLDALQLWVEQERTGEFEGDLLECRDSGLITLSDVSLFTP